MDTNKELVKLQSILRVPVTNVIFRETYCEVYSSLNQHLGNMPIYHIAGILNYDSDIQVVNNFNWGPLYMTHKSVIDEKIHQAVGSNDLEITLGTFRRLYVRDEGGNLIGSYECVYDNTWSVYKSNPS